MFGLNHPFLFAGLWLIFCLDVAVVLAFNSVEIGIIVICIAVGLLPIVVMTLILLKAMTDQ